MKTSSLRYIALLAGWVLCLTCCLPANANKTVKQQRYSRVYNENHPLIITGDWDKPPYEYLDERGVPAGTNIDVMTAITKQLGIPCRFILKEWAYALKQFDRGDADIILANPHRYKTPPFYISKNIINYNRIMAVTLGTTHSTFSLKELVDAGTVLKPSDYSMFYFLHENPDYLKHLEFQSPKIALLGVISKDFKYYVWGEEPLKWKIKQFHMEKAGLVLNDVGIPISEIHVIGRDKQLISDIDRVYTQLKQNGKVAMINDHWIHPEREHSESIPSWVYLILGIVIFTCLIYIGNRIVRYRVNIKMQRNRTITDMMTSALNHGHYYVVQYDITKRLLTNLHGDLLPKNGMTWNSFRQRFHPADRRNTIRTMEKLITAKDGEKLDLQARWNAGTNTEPKWIFLRGHFVVECDSKGKPVFIHTVVADVSHDMSRVHESREQEIRYNSFFNMSNVAIAIYDRDGWLLDVNKKMRFVCRFENSKNEQYYRNLNLFDMPYLQGVIEKNQRAPIYISTHLMPHENDLNIETYVEYYIVPICDAYGRIINYIVMALDIRHDFDIYHQLYLLNKDIEHQEKEVTTIEDRIHYILTKSHMMLWNMNMSDKFVRYSTYLNHDEYTDNLQDYITRVIPDANDNYTESDRQISQFQEDFHTIRKLKTTIFTDQPSWHEIFGRITKDSNGFVSGYHGFLRNISTTVSLRQELQDVTERTKNTAQQKSMFLASMTHELRTPLNSIVGFSDMLKYAENKEERQKFINIIQNNCEILHRLIDGILEASAISDNPMNVEPKDVDFAEEFDFLCQATEPRANNHNLKFIRTAPYKVMETTLDWGRIRQVISNFVSNALKHTKKGHLHLGYRLEERDDKQGIYVYCEDTGTGIPADKREAVFERFVKLNEFVQGTGLGLAISKSIIEGCHGYIGVDSVYGEGSTFWFWIPADIRRVERL